MTDESLDSHEEGRRPGVALVLLAAATGRVGRPGRPGPEDADRSSAGDEAGHGRSSAGTSPRWEADAVRRLAFFHALVPDARGHARRTSAWLGWGRRAFSESDLATAVEDLRATPFRRFTHNFLRVFNRHPRRTSTGSTTSPPSSAMPGWPREVARAGQVWRGILLDRRGVPGESSSPTRAQRDVKTKSWAEVRGAGAAEGVGEGHVGVPAGGSPG